MSVIRDSSLGGNNLYSDLGFPQAEAQNLLLRGELVIHIRKGIDKLGITQWKLPNALALPSRA